MNIQFLHDQTGKMLFAVLPYDTYVELIGKKELSLASASAPLSKEETDISEFLIKLPYAGKNTYLSLVSLARFFVSNAIQEMAVNKRAQSFQMFPKNQRNSLDYIIRRDFVDEPYRNTMQASKVVVDDLINSGLFDLVKAKFNEYGRAVYSIRAREQKIIEFVKKTQHIDAKEILYSIDVS
ncbi:MAG: hypothetical protein PHU14_13300 [Methylovulum sp.]|nr:hypothetical protein [Methylovulum sp.]